MASEKTATLGSVRRAFEIIDHLSDHPNSRLADLNEQLDIPKSTIYIHLQTFHEAGYIVKEDERYRLSYRFLHHGGKLRHSSPLYRYGRDPAKELAENTGELVNLGIEENGLGVVLHMVQGGPTAVELEPIGKYSYLHQAAYGKAILAEYAEERIREIIQQHGLPEITEHTITEETELFEELAEIRQRGFAVERNEGDIGIGCIGAPVSLGDGKGIGAVSVTVPSSKFENRDFIEETTQYILDCSNIIEVKTHQLSEVDARPR